MKFLYQYINDFRAGDSESQKLLADLLDETQSFYSIFANANPIDGLEAFVERYNWLGNSANKLMFNFNQNLSRNLTAAFMQDYLISLVIKLCQSYPKLEVFTEVRVPFGRRKLSVIPRYLYLPVSYVVEAVFFILTQAKNFSQFG